MPHIQDLTLLDTIKEINKWLDKVNSSEESIKKSLEPGEQEPLAFYTFSEGAYIPTYLELVGESVVRVCSNVHPSTMIQEPLVREYLVNIRMYAYKNNLRIA